MNKITLTKKGSDILSQNTLQGGEVYWVGYFGLAYVPDQSKFDTDSTWLIGNDEQGDYIYNLWQGDLVNEGHSIASDNLRKLTMYDRNITSNFRYMYDDEKDCNRLVTWTTKDDSESGSSSYVREGYHIYNGITQGESNNAGDTVTDSELPCPAPLFYAGGSASYGTAPENPADFMNTVSADWPKYTVSGGECPMVTPDMRAYPGTWAGATGTGWDWVPQNAGKYDTLPSYITRKTAAGEDGAESLDQYAKFLSVSNFNKEHGHVSAEGYNVGYQESCHNMSMVTRLFPIASYELTATSEPSTNDPNRSERGSAKSIKYVIRMDLKSAYQGVRAYLDTLTYQKSDTEGVDPEEIAVYTSKKPNSFKFNRIGIYAVPVTIRHFYKEGDAANRTDCRATHYQMEISPDAKPELFAVMQVDEVCMSEDGSFGLSDYNTTFVLNLENVSGNTSLCTNPEVYYNLAENEAITWYQNQLIATAGLSEAVTNLGVNMAHMMNRLEAGTGTGMCNQSTSEKIQVTYDGLKNLVDDLGGDGSVRGIKSATSSMPLPALNKEACKWTSGVLSFTMGDNNATLGDYSFNMTVNGDIDEASKHVVLVGGEKGETELATNSLTVRNSDYSVIVGKPGEYTGVHNSLLLAGHKDDIEAGITGASDSLLVSTGRLGNYAVFENSTVDFCGTDIEESDEYTLRLYPSRFSNVVWHGAANLVPRSFIDRNAYPDGPSEAEREFYEAPVHDLLVLGDENATILHDWLGKGYRACSIYSCLKADSTISEEIRPEDIAQPYDAPMIFTGGIALGGHLTTGREPMGTLFDYCVDPCAYGLLKLGTTYGNTATQNLHLYRNSREFSVVVAGGPMAIYHGNSFTDYADGGNTAESPLRLFSTSSGAGSKHYAVHSPHAGKPLTVGETQELDGTLHMVLGQDYRYGNTGTTKLSTSYISFTDNVNLYAFRVNIDVNSEHKYVIEARWDKSGADSLAYNADNDSESIIPSYYRGPDVDHLTPMDAGTTEVKDTTADIGLSMQFHWHNNGSQGYEMVVENMEMKLPTDFPNYYRFVTGDYNGRNTGKFVDGMAPVIYMRPCQNNTDTNVYIDYEWTTIFEERDPMLSVIAGSVDGTGSISATRIVARMDRNNVYRLSATNYHGLAVSNIPESNHGPIILSYQDADGKTGYPMRVERIPVNRHFNYDIYRGECERIPSDPVELPYRIIDVDIPRDRVHTVVELIPPKAYNAHYPYHTVPSTYDQTAEYYAVLRPQENTAYTLIPGHHGTKWISTVRLEMNSDIPENGEFWIESLEEVDGHTLAIEKTDIIYDPRFLRTESNSTVVVDGNFVAPLHLKKIAVNGDHTEFKYLVLSDSRVAN